MPGTVLGPEDAEMSRGTPALPLTPRHLAGSPVGKSEPQQCGECSVRRLESTEKKRYTSREMAKTISQSWRHPH